MAGSTGSTASTASTSATTGTVLLLAASPMGKGCLVDAASVLPVLAAVSPAVLSGTDTANVVELADPLEPQAVLTRLRAAAVTPGPLTVYLTGQLQLDRKQHLPHLALARTTPATVRYTGFPWHWIAEELRLRAPGTTTLFLDLHADAAAWQHVTGRVFDAGRGVSVYGRVAPPPPRRAVGVPAYMKTVATILRSGYRPDAGRLHQQALGRLSSEGVAYGDVVLAWDAVSGAGVKAGSPGVNAGSASPPPPLPVPSPGGFAPRPPESPRAQRPPEGPLNPAATPPGRPEEVPLRVGDAVESAPRRLAVVPRAGTEVSLRDAEASRRDAEASRRDEEAPLRVAGGVPRPAAEVSLRGGDDPRRAESVPRPGERVSRRVEAADGSDPHSFITSAVQAGRHADADAVAARWEQAAFREHGAASEEALHWTEVRADLAMFAGDPARSCRAWLTVAGTRLSAGQASDAPAVEAAVDRAHHQWTSLGESADARELGPVVVELRRRVPGRREGAVLHAERQLQKLESVQHVPG